MTLGENGTFLILSKSSGNGRKGIIQTKSNEKPLRDKSYQTQQKDERGRECVYCEKPDHRSDDCKTVNTLDERKRLLSDKHLCFNLHRKQTQGRRLQKSFFVPDLPEKASHFYLQ